MVSIMQASEHRNSPKPDGHKRVPVTCKDCGKTWDKYEHTLQEWQGRCRSCARKEVYARPGMRERQRERARDQVRQQGGIPRTPESLRRFGASNSAWKGGLPKCADCGAELPSRQARRCRACERKNPAGGPGRGADHHFWRGGTSSERKLIYASREYKAWRNAVFTRDDYTCVLCGARSAAGAPVELEADHIIPWSERRDLLYDVSNGRTLCVPCHRQTDTYGWKQLHKLHRLSKPD